MEAQTEEIGEPRCPSTCGGHRCMLAPDHSGAIMHCAIGCGELREWSVSDEPKKEGYWRGYWIPDVHRALAIAQESAIAIGSTYTVPEGDGPIVNHQPGCGDSPSGSDENHLRRVGGLRKETEDDYKWEGYTLADIKKANARYLGDGAASDGAASAGTLISRAGEKWYLEKGDIWATRPSHKNGEPYRPWYGNARFICNATKCGYLTEKEKKKT